MKIVSKKESIELPKFHFDSDLKEVPDNFEEWKSFCNELKSKLNDPLSLEEELQCYEFLGVAKRILRELQEAEAYLQKAVSLAHTYPKISRLIQNLIRLAHVYQWAGEFEKSQGFFDQAGELISDNEVSEYLVAAYRQHLGKLYFDQGKFEKAREEFELALSIRTKISAPKDQIESSQMSLEAAIAKLKTT